jgi:hypothetical protein
VDDSRAAGARKVPEACDEPDVREERDERAEDEERDMRRAISGRPAANPIPALYRICG